jgi:uncharacterized protein YggU (UPF0235/DUF167 family)
LARPKVRLELSEACLDVALREIEAGLRLVLSAKPRSKQEGLEVGPDGGLLVRVSAPPVDGKANARITEVVAAALGVPRGAVVFVRGESARHKELEIAGLSLAEARDRLLASGP